MSEKMTILVVDDSRSVRAALKKYLDDHYIALEAEDGEAGWEALMAHPEIGLVISDIQMPRLDGYGFICRIRAANNPQIRKKPVVVITGAEDETTLQRAYACGANDFIRKPLDISDLVTRVRSLLEPGLDGNTHVAPAMKQYESAIVATVMEAPDVGRALKILKGEETGVITPYIVDLCLEVMPLFEHASDDTGVDIAQEIASIRAKLEAQHW